MRIFFILLTFPGFSYLPMHGEENFILINGSTNEIIREFGSSIGEQATPLQEWYLQEQSILHRVRSSLKISPKEQVEFVQK